jgi:hypothetical protein
VTNLKDEEKIPLEIAIPYIIALFIVGASLSVKEFLPKKAGVIIARTVAAISFAGMLGSVFIVGNNVLGVISGEPEMIISKQQDNDSIMHESLMLCFGGIAFSIVSVGAIIALIETEDVDQNKSENF